MSAITKKKLTEAEYLAIERAAEFKSEFYNGEMFAMAGASHQHSEIKENLISQERKLVERFVRQPDDAWLLTTFDDPDGEFLLATVPVRVPLADVYRGVELSEKSLR